MAGFGAKVSLPGFPVQTAADQDLYFNSSWPLLKIDESLSGTTSSSITVNHNLGYPPFTMLFSHLFGFLGAATVNSKNYSLNPQTGDTYQYYTFRNPLNQNFQSPNIQLAETAQGTNHQDWGIKFSKPGKDTSSTDLRDFRIHSGTKSLQVHQVLFGQIPSSGFSYTTDLPYNPVFFAFFSTDNDTFTPVYAANQQDPKITFNSITGAVRITYDIFATSSQYGSFFILLDPFQTTTKIKVTL